MQSRLRGLAVAAGTTELLIVGVHRVGSVGVHDEAHVLLVDPHPERRRRHDDIQLIGEERLVHAGALLRRHPRVICRRAQAALVQLLCVALGVAPSRRVHQTRRRQLRDLVDDGGALVGIRGVPAHGQCDVGAVQVAHAQRGLLQAQAPHDLCPHGCGSRRGQSDDRGPPEPLGERTEHQVVGAEVVPPRRDAVRLVDHEQRHLQIGERGQHVLLRELLRCQQHELRIARPQTPPRFAVRPRAPRGVQGDAIGGIRRVLQTDELILLQRDQR